MDKNLLLLFDRPNEPVYIPKGEEKINFDVPPEYLSQKYQPIAQKILNRFGNESSSSVPIKQISIPDLSVPLQLGRQEGFSLFIPSHQKMAAYLTTLFMGMRTVEDLISLAAFCRDRINPQMFIYCLSVAILNRPDTKHLTLPKLSEVFPNKFMDSSIFSRAKEEANILPAGTRTPIEIPLDYTASQIEPEQRIAYFREDVGINLHHWHWHLVYPFDGPREVVNKDRRGELFYYMHHQVIARYNCERLCNALARVVPLTNLREPLPQGYFPKMDQVVAGRAWPARPINMTISDVNRPVDSLTLNISEIEQARDRILDAIRTHTVRNDQGQIIQLDERNGIDILGNMIEASILSPSRNFYGNIHNSGHNAISFIHDPDHRFLESFAVMGDSATAMRDPIFYRWHMFIDELFVLFKDSLPPYSNQQLSFPGVTVSDVRIVTPGANPNTLNSHWNKSDMELSRGLDFTPRGSTMVRVQHLNHDNFSYSISVNNMLNREVTGTVRIFIAPKYDENGRNLSFNDQRKLMIEMDKFTVKLKRGQNSIARRSDESAVTIPFEATFRNLDNSRPRDDDISSSLQFNFCGCGWPAHMLVPKGTRQGYPMDLFVMVSNYDLDRINQAEASGCSNGISFCGLRDLKYPDARAMGYPFDRVIPSVNNFLTSNMKIQQITVRFEDVVEARQATKRS